MKSSPIKGKELPAFLADLGDQVHRYIEQLPCVYFLVKNVPEFSPRIVYVGSSADLANRLKHHRQKYDYDDVYLVEVQDASKLKRIEHALIRGLRPQYNVNGKTSRYFVLDDVKNSLRNFGFRVHTHHVCNECEDRRTQGIKNG